MTREEAIKLLTQYIDYDAETPDYYKMEEACKVAIKALSAEPCEDCISRDAVQNYVESHIQEINTGYGDLNNHTNRILRMIVDGIGNLPSIQPKPKTGHCKDCKWWKDSDGIYRRGIRAESSCPFNTKEIYEGDAFCYKFESQERNE